MDVTMGLFSPLPEDAIPPLQLMHGKEEVIHTGKVWWTVAGICATGQIYTSVLSCLTPIIGGIVLTYINLEEDLGSKRGQMLSNCPIITSSK